MPGFLSTPGAWVPVVAGWFCGMIYAPTQSTTKRCICLIIIRLKDIDILSVKIVLHQIAKFHIGLPSDSLSLSLSLKSKRQQMTRESTIFHIRYSFHIETMQATFYSRLDRLLTFSQIMLGSAIFATYGSLPLFGAIVASLSAISFVWQPSKTAMLCEAQSKKMKELITKPDSTSDSELHAAYVKAEETDNPMLGLLRDAAYIRTLIVLGRSSEAISVKLSFIQKAAAWFAGDLPKP